MSIIKHKESRMIRFNNVCDVEIPLYDKRMNLIKKGAYKSYVKLPGCYLTKHKFKLYHGLFFSNKKQSSVFIRDALNHFKCDNLNDIKDIYLKKVIEKMLSSLFIPEIKDITMKYLK